MLYSLLRPSTRVSLHMNVWDRLMSYLEHWIMQSHHLQVTIEREILITCNQIDCVDYLSKCFSFRCHRGVLLSIIHDILYG